MAIRENVAAVTEYTAYSLLYDRLLDLGANGKYPALATGSTISAGGKQIDFDLRKNVQFQNGDPFSAEDVKFTYDTVIREGNTHSYRKDDGRFDRAVLQSNPTSFDDRIRQPC